MTGWLSKVLSSARVTVRGQRATDIKTDPGGAFRTARQFQPSGDDSLPLPGDYAYEVPVDGAGRSAAIGYQDNATPKSSSGEKRIYSRSGAGELVAEVYLQGDGSILVQKVGGPSITLSGASLVKIDGDLEVTGNIDADGDITSGGEVADLTGNITTVRTQYNAHNHGASPGNPPTVPMT